MFMSLYAYQVPETHLPRRSSNHYGGTQEEGKTRRDTAGERENRGFGTAPANEYYY